MLNHSDAVVQNPIVGKTSQNPALRQWHTNNLDRLPGLKFMRTMWVCTVTGGPCKYTPTNHAIFHAEFVTVIERGRTAERKQEHCGEA